MSQAGLGPKKDCAGEGPSAIVNDTPILSSEKMLHKDYCRKSSVEKKLVVSLKGLDAKTN
jgi:hypothetical protein